MKKIYNDDTRGYYLPHHLVVRDSLSTKFRVVFNASAPTTNGLSLNDIMEAGPKLQTDIGEILTKWRLHKYAVTADIEKMFGQIQLDEEQQKFLKIFYRFKNQPKIQSYQMTTVTYGTKFNGTYMIKFKNCTIKIINQIFQNKEVKINQELPRVYQISSWTPTEMKDVTLQDIQELHINNT